MGSKIDEAGTPEKGAAPNPQGKGANETLEMLVDNRSRSFLPTVEEDSVERIVGEYLNSLFVLSCSFKFKPVPGQSYFLYSHNKEIVLSLVEPDNGGENIYDAYLGECFYSLDLSWRVVLADGGELRYGTGREHAKSPVEEAREVLETIMAADSWRRNSGLGYYQNALTYLLLKTLRYRCRRLQKLNQSLEGLDRLLLDTASPLDHQRS